MTFIGKFAAVGMGGAGKTRAVLEIANFLSGQKKYSWSEEEYIAGTMTVTPYSIILPNKNKKIIIADNPGQNSLELVRISVAKSGGDYKGILIFADALGWNFNEVGIIHAESIAQYLNSNDLPVAFITSKADMIIKMQQTGLLTDIAGVIANAVTLTFDKMMVPFFDRIKRKSSHFQLKKNDDWIPFTHIEQIIVNELDDKFKDEVEGFTYMNRRLLARSLLLGYCDYYKKEFPEYVKSYPVFNAIDDNLLNSLNYHRPSAMETDTPWPVLAALSRSGITNKNEIPFRTDAFDEDGIEYVLRNFCLGTQSRHYQLEGEMRERATENGWKFIASAYTDSISRPGIERGVKCIEKLVNEADKGGFKVNQSKIDSLGLNEF